MLILYISELCRTDVTDLVHINTKMALDFGKLFLALANDTIEYQKNLHVFFKKSHFMMHLVTTQSASYALGHSASAEKLT